MTCPVGFLGGKKSGWLRWVSYLVAYWMKRYLMKPPDKKEIQKEQSLIGRVQLCFSFMREHPTKHPAQLDLFENLQGDKNGKAD
tara:strand:- start:86 stop:337 length:252 start_codon:yes stop_codon:yes gene_type:complete